MIPHQSAHPATRRQKIIPIKNILFFYLEYTIIVKLCQYNVHMVFSSNFNNVILNKRIEIVFLFRFI